MSISELQTHRLTPSTELQAMKSDQFQSWFGSSWASFNVSRFSVGGNISRFIPGMRKLCRDWRYVGCPGLVNYLVSYLTTREYTCEAIQ